MLWCRRLLRFESLLICWILVFGCAFLDTVDLSDELPVAKLTWQIAIESDDIDEPDRHASTASSPSLWANNSLVDTLLHGPYRTTSVVERIKGPVPPQYDLLEVFRV